MIVAVTNYGTRLNKRNGLLEITEKTGDVRSMPFQNVNEIILSVPCSLTSEVFLYTAGDQHFDDRFKGNAVVAGRAIPRRKCPPTSP